MKGKTTMKNSITNQCKELGMTQKQIWIVLKRLHFKNVEKVAKVNNQYWFFMNEQYLEMVNFFEFSK